MMAEAHKRQEKSRAEDRCRLEKELEAASKLSEERLSQIKYLQADFENYRKSFEKEKAKIIELAEETLISGMLPILDELEKAMKSLDESGRKGVGMVYRNLMKLLESRGLRRIDAAGKRFDPGLHEAVLSEPSDKDEGTVMEELQTGFMLKSKVIRHSKVKVAGKGAEDGQGKDNRH